MRTVSTVTELRDALAPERRRGRSIGLVPTMGDLHAGHLALLDAARTRCDVVVLSAFVNPTQFDDPADLAAYPRDSAADAALAAEHGADLLFAPGTDEVYPPGFCTSVTVSGLSEPLEGAFRGPGHFAGVATVVLKLLNMAGPDVAFFGQKDAQQALVVSRLVRDLDLPVEIQVVPTVREADGLALSSRNVRLSPSERERALALPAALSAVREAAGAAERDPVRLAARGRAAMKPFGVQPEYLALVDPETLAPLARIDGDALVAVAARVGGTRLIDNTLVHVDREAAPRGPCNA